jgi:RNA polymerase sigma-70 factor (ECF subfamily)
LVATNRTHEDTVADEVLAAAAQNDHAAFDVLYRRYVTRIYRYCYTRTDNVQAAEDLTTQTFLAALEGIGRYRGDGSFAAWLFGIASNKCKVYHRRRRRRPQEPLQKARHLPDAGRLSLERGAYEQSILDCVQSVMPQLSVDRQEVIRLRFLAGLNTAETARVMDRRRGAVRTLLSRAIGDLRERCLHDQ